MTENEIQFLFDKNNIALGINNKLFETAKQSLKIYVSESKKSPSLKKNPYSDFSQDFKELQFTKFLNHEFTSNRIILYTNQSNQRKIVLKRCYLWLKLEYLDLFSSVYKFLEDKYNEYIIMSEAYSSFCLTVRPFGFNIILLYNHDQKYFVTELLMEYGGKSVTNLNLKKLRLNRGEYFWKLFQQVSFALKNLEKLGIIHGDLKVSNILIQKKESSRLI